MAKMNFKKMSARVTGNALPAVAGGVGSLLLNKVTPTSINNKMRGALKIVVGAILPELSPKTKMLSPLADGLIGHAGAELATEFMPKLADTKVSATAGVGASYEIDEDYKVKTPVSGTDEVSPIGSVDDETEVAY